MKRLTTQKMTIITGGFSIRGFCAGWIGGIGVALTLGATLGPFGTAAVIGGIAVCIGTQG